MLESRMTYLEELTNKLSKIIDHNIGGYHTKEFGINDENDFWKRILICIRVKFDS